MISSSLSSDMPAGNLAHRLALSFASLVHGPPLGLKFSNVVNGRHSSVGFTLPSVLLF